MKFKCIFYFIFTVLLFSHIFCCHAKKKGITDTLYVSFGLNDSIPLNVRIDTIYDQRTDHSSHVINIYEKKKYLFIPYDVFEYTNLPLSSEIKNSFIRPEIKYPVYSLYLKDFYINSLYKSFSNGRRIFSELQVIVIDSLNNRDSIGTLIYDTYYKGKKKKATQPAIDQWKTELAGDLNKINYQIKNNQEINLYNLHSFNSQIKSNFITNAYLNIGLKSIITDGELIFSNPEASRKFIRQGYKIRYRNSDDFESLEFAQINEHINYRLNDNFIFKFKTNYFLGINKWKNIIEVDHHMADILIIDISASQAIEYNPFFKKSVIAGLCIMEDVYFIYSKIVKFEPFIGFYIGMKL